MKRHSNQHIFNNNNNKIKNDVKTFRRTALGLRGVDKLNESRVLLVEQDLDSHHVAVHTYNVISPPRQRLHCYQHYQDVQIITVVLSQKSNAETLYAV